MTFCVFFVRRGGALIPCRGKASGDCGPSAAHDPAGSQRQRIRRLRPYERDPRLREDGGEAYKIALSAGKGAMSGRRRKRVR